MPTTIPKAAKWLSERVHAPAVVLPYSVGGTPAAKDLFGLFDDTLDRLLGAANMNLFSTEMSILWPALIAGLLVVVSHVPLGQQVFARGIVFIDLAIAQVAGLGVIAASSFGLPVEGWTAQAAAGAAALAGALLLTWTERKRPEAQEALIGILFVLASAAQILLLANDPHGGENLKDLLSGQILWVSQAQLIRTAILTAVFAVVWFLWRERIGRIGFYLMFAVMVTASVQLVGVYLVFTSLIVPAVATYRMAGESSAPGRVPARNRELCRRACALGRDRPAVELGDRVGDGARRALRSPGERQPAKRSAERLKCRPPPA